MLFRSDDYLNIIGTNIDKNASINQTRLGLYFVEFVIKDNLPGNRRKIMRFHIHKIGDGLFGLLLMNDNSEVNLLDSNDPDEIYKDLDIKIDKLIHDYFYEPDNPFKLKKMLEQFNINDPYDEEDWDDFEKGNLLIAKKDRYNSKKKKHIITGDKYWVTDILRWNTIKYYSIARMGSFKDVAVIQGSEMNDYFEKISGFQWQ